MDIKDFKKIRTQQDLNDYLKELDDALQAIVMNDGVSSDTSLYASLCLCKDALNYARNECHNFDVKQNSFKDE